MLSIKFWISLDIGPPEQEEGIQSHKTGLTTRQEGLEKIQIPHIQRKFQRGGKYFNLFNKPSAKPIDYSCWRSSCATVHTVTLDVERGPLTRALGVLRYAGYRAEGSYHRYFRQREWLIYRDMGTRVGIEDMA